MPADDIIHSFILQANLYNPETFKVRPMDVDRFFLNNTLYTKAKILLDSGAQGGSYINENYYNANAKDFLPFTHPWHIKVLFADGINSESILRYAILPTIILHNNVRYTVLILYALFPMKQFDAIIGLPHLVASLICLFIIMLILIYYYATCLHFHDHREQHQPSPETKSCHPLTV
jgi:hypothetical protein